MPHAAATSVSSNSVLLNIGRNVTSVLVDRTHNVFLDILKDAQLTMILRFYTSGRFINTLRSHNPVVVLQHEPAESSQWKTLVCD